MVIFQDAHSFPRRKMGFFGFVCFGELVWGFFWVCLAGGVVMYCGETFKTCSGKNVSCFEQKTEISVWGWVGSTYFQLQKVVGALFGDKALTSAHGKGRRRWITNCPCCCCSSHG